MDVLHDSHQPTTTDYVEYNTKNWRDIVSDEKTGRIENEIEIEM